MSTMSTEIPVQSRFSIHLNPNVAPGTCCVCKSPGSDDGRLFIDFGFQLDFYGAVYFCTHCFAEASLFCGYVPAERYDNLSDSYSKLNDAFHKLQIEFQEHKDATRTFLRNCTYDDDGGNSVCLESPEKGNSESEGTDSKPAKRSAKSD